MNSNIRRVVRRGNNYQVLKPLEGDSENPWHPYGRRKDIRGIAFLISQTDFELQIDPDVQVDLDRYQSEESLRRDQREEYRRAG